MVISYAWLTSHGACRAARNQFRRAFPGASEVPVTFVNLVAMAGDKYDLIWIAMRILSSRQRAAFFRSFYSTSRNIYHRALVRAWNGRASDANARKAAELARYFYLARRLVRLLAIDVANGTEVYRTVAR